MILNTLRISDPRFRTLALFASHALSLISVHATVSLQFIAEYF